MLSEGLGPLRYGGHVHANGIRQHYLRFGGGGPPLIVIPGITSPAATWAFVGERLAVAHDTYVIDVRGRGLSQAGPDLRYDLDSCAADVAALGAALGLSRYSVLGHSLGARIAARLATKHGASLERIVLADPPLSGPGRRPYGRSLAYYLEPIHLAQQGRLDAESVRAAYPAWSEAHRRTRAEWLHTCDETAIAANVRGFQEEEIISDLAALAVKTLLLVAGTGGVITAADIHELGSIAPSLRVETIAGAGHMIPFDDLEGFVAAVLAFLEH